MKKATVLLFVFSLAAVIVSGCAKKEGSAPEAKAPAAGAPAATASGDSVGVPECDDYVTKYQNCLKGKIPEAAQAAMKGAFDTTVAEWKKVAANPEGRSGLAMACRSALDASKQAMGAYGCEW